MKKSNKILIISIIVATVAVGAIVMVQYKKYRTSSDNRKKNERKVVIERV